MKTFETGSFVGPLGGGPNFRTLYLAQDFSVLGVVWQRPL